MKQLLPARRSSREMLDQYSIREATVKLYRGTFVPPMDPLRWRRDFTCQGAHPQAFDWAVSLSLTCARGAPGLSHLFLGWGGERKLPRRTFNQWRSGFMWLENCTDEEALILMAIAALAAALPGNPAEYADALVEINRAHFDLSAPKLPSHNPAGRSVMIPRKGK